MKTLKQLHNASEYRKHSLSIVIIHRFTDGNVKPSRSKFHSYHDSAAFVLTTDPRLKRIRRHHSIEMLENTDHTCMFSDSQREINTFTRSSLCQTGPRREFTTAVGQ